jgi:hypothetical protein
MKTAAMAISVIALVLTLLPALLFLSGSIESPTVSRLMFIGTIAWFAATPWWMERTERRPE